MKTLYIHIGSHKTATTLIQKVLSNLSDQFSSEGITYLASGRELFGHHGIALRASSGAGCDELRALIAEETKGSTNDILISSENFELLSADGIRRLLSLFDVERTRVLYVVRSWAPVLYSNWQEEVKHGSSISYFEFAFRHLVAPYQSRLLNYSLTADEWISAVGRDSIAIVSYEMSCARSSILKSFFSWLGKEPTDARRLNSRVNASLSPYEIETIRALNEFAHTRGYTADMQVRLRYFNSVRGSGDAKYTSVLNALMQGHEVDVPCTNESSTWVSFSNNFIRQYSDIITGDPVEHLHDATQSRARDRVIGPNYLWEPLAKMALAQLWETISISLRRAGVTATQAAR